MLSFLSSPFSRSARPRPGFDVPSWSDPELGLFCIKRAEYVDVSSFKAKELWPIPNWLCLALFSGFRFPPASLATGHWPLAPIPSHSPYQKHPTSRAAFRLGRRAGRFAL